MWDFLLERFFEWLFGGGEENKKDQRVEVEVSGSNQVDAEVSSSNKSEYFNLMDKNELAKEKGNYIEALGYALEALPHFKEVDHREDVNNIWPLTEAFKYLPVVKEGKAELRKVKEVVDSDPKIDEKWFEEVENSLEDAEIMHEILEFLSKNPGFPQSELWAEFDVDGRKWAPKIDYAEQVGAIEKKEEEGKNKLFAQGKPSLK